MRPKLYWHIPLYPVSIPSSNRSQRHFLRGCLFLILLQSCLYSCATPTSEAKTVIVSPSPRLSTPTPTPTPDDTAVLTAKDDVMRTGLQSHETHFKLENVNAVQFGLRARYAVDGSIYSQPLFMPNLFIQHMLYNVVFIATEHDSVYAFDANALESSLPLWHTSFIDPASGITPFSSKDVFGCTDLGSEIGITGTPVIDKTTQVLYVVAATKEHGQLIQKLHALNILTGQERAESPQQIQASVAGSGDGSISGQISFNAQTENQRAALLLDNGIVSIAWGSFCDQGYYHGWIMGYNATTLQQVGVYNDTPAGYQGGIWQSGGGLAADSSHNIYASLGNGTYNLNTGGLDSGGSILKLTTQHGFQVSDYFTPFNQLCLSSENADMGSTGVLLLPHSNYLVTSSKEGRIYLIDRDNMGKFVSIAQPCDNQNRFDVDQIVQELPPHTLTEGMYSVASYWDSPYGNYIYMNGVNDHIKIFDLNNNTLSLISQTVETFSFPGSGSTISCDGNNADTGILWVLDPGAVLRAYDANNLQRELYNSNENASRDALSSYVKFSTPTVGNGEVFIGTKDSLMIYGQLPA